MATAPTPITANAPLSEYDNYASQWAGDSLGANAPYSPNSQLNSFQQQQTQLNGNGGFGYVAGGGDDMTGSAYAQANPWATSAASSGGSPLGDLVNNQITNQQGAYAPGIETNTPSTNIQNSAVIPYGNTNPYSNGATVYEAQVSSAQQTPNAANYPTYSNSFGLGTGTGGASTGSSPTPMGNSSLGSTPAGGQYGAAPTFNPSSFQSVLPQTPSPSPYSNTGYSNAPGAPTISSTTGFNPWSMGGEANSRTM